MKQFGFKISALIRKNLFDHTMTANNVVKNESSCCFGTETISSRALNILSEVVDCDYYVCVAATTCFKRTHEIRAN